MEIKKNKRGRPPGSAHHRGGPNTYHLENEWYPDKPLQSNTHRVERLMRGNDSRELKIIKKLANMPQHIPQPRYATVYALKNLQWQIIGFRCFDCGRALGKLSTLEKHPLVCTHELMINKTTQQETQEFVFNKRTLEDIDMPIQKVMKDNETYYRYGIQGRLYKNRADAVKNKQKKK
jgi:hypothetical protein